ncbi:hypothetical protein DPMN_066453 [Dreissena polymorpha]|uniref:Uncharacterized protein n=1 Tax=Dreissena polymorpha TaxID=45954 RepID=A0A9D4BV14_DREPO|nr:hypothetical protein DPMN_066453 [Dreissena polymorpha]
MPVEVERQISEVIEPLAKKPCIDDSMAGPVLRFAKLTAKAFTPTRGSKLAAGYDLYRHETLSLIRETNYMNCHSLGSDCHSTICIQKIQWKFSW